VIYLDNAATSFPKPEVVYQSMDSANRNLAFNAGRGGYKGAREAQSKIIRLKKSICKMVGLVQDESNILLTESATIASNIVINGLDFKRNDVIYLSPFEHNAIARPIELLRKKIGFKVNLIPYNKDLSLNVNKLRHMLVTEPGTHLFISLVGNVLGNVVNVKDLVESFEKKPVVVIDVSQALGMINVDFHKLECDYMIFAGHKTLYGPIGVGGVISTKLAQLVPSYTGGTGSDSLNIITNQVQDVGSPNIVAVTGLLAGINWINSIGVEKIEGKIRKLRSDLLSALDCIDEIKVHPDTEYDGTGIVAITHEEYSPEELANILDEEFEICVRAGYQCAPFVHELIGSKNTAGVVRISLGYFNEISEVKAIANALSELD
jgi:selenocysteine lyase/cysteine desulfurase